MQPQTDGDHKKLLTEVIKKQIVILGPDITLTKARNVTGITVADDGTVTELTGDPQEVTKQLIEQFMELSGMIVKKTMEPLLAAYPTLAAEQTIKTTTELVNVAGTPPPSSTPPPPTQPTTQTNSETTNSST